MSHIIDFLLSASPTPFSETAVFRKKKDKFLPPDLIRPSSGYFGQSVISSVFHFKMLARQTKLTPMSPPATALEI
jgi:hypothetical protein